MKKILFLLFGIFPILASAQENLTLDECYDLVEKNYPLAKQTALLKEKSKAEIKVLEKERLPKLDLNAQATYQSDVIHFPFQIPNFNIQFLNKDQYRATIDANQLIYNGTTSLRTQSENCGTSSPGRNDISGLCQRNATFKHQKLGRK